MSEQEVVPSSEATLLLIEPDPGRAAGRSLFLHAAGYAVTTAANSRDVQAQDGTKFISIVLVSETVERARLRDVTESSRRKWPLARIVILGQAQRILDDHLYDDAIEEPFSPKLLLDTLRLILMDPWCQRSQPRQAAQAELREDARPSTPHMITPRESDPGKIHLVTIPHPSQTWDAAEAKRARN